MTGLPISILWWVLQIQPESGVNVDIDLGTGLGGGAVGAFLSTLLVGAIMLALVPEYTERQATTVFDDPVDSFLYGLFFLLALAVVIVLLVITILGILFAIPLMIVAALMWTVGSVVAYLAIADRLVGHEDGWLKPLAIGAGINGGLALTGIGAVVSFCVGAVGFGAVLRDYMA